jgi:molecular chaperone GrpE
MHNKDKNKIKKTAGEKPSGISVNQNLHPKEGVEEEKAEEKKTPVFKSFDKDTFDAVKAEQSHPKKGTEEKPSETGKQNQREDTAEEIPGEDEETKELPDQEIIKLKEHLQRERAEFQNYKKRMASEMIRTRQWSINNFVSDFLAVFDSLENVINQKDGDLESFISGVKLIQKDYLSALDKNNIQILDPVDQKFDPEVMEAVHLEEDADVQEETVSQVFQKGFYAKYKDKVYVIRPARVVVKKPAKK